MNAGSSADDGPSALVRTANVLVVLALVAMLVGAVVLLLAREHGSVDLHEGQEAVVLDREIPDTAVAGESFGLQVTTNGTTNVTVVMEETSGTGQREENTTNLQRGQRLVWGRDADAGEHWVVTVSNEGPGLARVAVTATSQGGLWVGGILVAFGVVGFVFHRIGMRKG